MAKKFLTLFLAGVFFFYGFDVSAQTYPGGLIIDHSVVSDFSQIPSEYITAAKNTLRLAYGHTSHGSQIVTGMGMLSNENSLYGYTTGSSGFLCDGCMSGAYDLGNPNRTAWETATRNYLNGAGSNRNVIVWSWCGQVGGTEAEIQTYYLDAMNRLESEFPNVQFVYMTGHLDGSGPAGTVYLRNNQIRNYCRNNGKALFDFADIESYNPDGVYFPNESDACNWCSSWCASHTCPTCGDCAHSHCFNCYNKGKAFWYLMARLAGWNSGDLDVTPPSAPSGLGVR